MKVLFIEVESQAKEHGPRNTGRPLISFRQAHKAKRKVSSGGIKRKKVVQDETLRDMEGRKSTRRSKRVVHKKKLAKKANCLRERSFRKNMNKIFLIELHSLPAGYLPLA
jgi:hypothetical protein